MTRCKRMVWVGMIFDGFNQPTKQVGPNGHSSEISRDCKVLGFGPRCRLQGEGLNPNLISIAGRFRESCPLVSNSTLRIQELLTF
jgi:hypothetical protein